MNDLDSIKSELDKLIDAREAFLAYLDEHIAKDKSGVAFDFSEHPTLDAQAVYEHFYKLDYQARKIRGFVIQQFNLKS